MHLYFQGCRILGQVFSDKPGFATAESQDPGCRALSNPSSWVPRAGARGSPMHLGRVLGCAQIDCLAKASEEKQPDAL